MTTLATTPLPTDRRVRVWFGPHVIASFVGDQVAAARYADGMRQRFASLRITHEPAAVIADAELS